MGILDRSESRDGYKVRVLAVHTTEGGGTAAELRDADWWVGSSHAIADDRTLLTPAEGMVPYDRAAWTLRSGNRWSENVELVAFAGWSRAQWLERPGLLDNCARWLADRSKARGIPLVKITAAQYRGGASGVIGHVDHTEGYSDGSHWDPGLNFPYDVVIPKAIAYAEGTPTPIEEDLLAAIKTAVVFASPKDGPDAQTVYECSMLNGTRVRIKDPQTLTDRKHWLTKCGVPWSEVGEVGRIDAFGVDITPA